MMSLVLKLASALGVLAMIYRLYLALSGYREKAIETKNSAVVNLDKQKDAQDASDIKKSTDDFESSVDDFNKRNN